MANSDLAGGLFWTVLLRKTANNTPLSDDALPALLLSGAESSERWILEHGKVGNSVRDHSRGAVSRNRQLERRFRS